MRVLLAPFVLACALVGTVHAQTSSRPSAPPAMGAPPPAPQGTFEENCGADVQTYCPTAAQGKERTHCLLQTPKVSQACTIYLRRHHAQRMQEQMKSGAPQNRTKALPKLETI